MSHGVTIQDNDNPPMVSVNDVTVSESGGAATFTVTVSAASAQTITVPFAAVAGTATPYTDYTPSAGSPLTLLPYQLSGTITAPVVADGVVEPTETLTLTLGTPVNAQLGDGQGIGQILDASSVIDLTLPGRYVADTTGGPGADDYVVVANPHGVAVPVLLTFVKPSGAWVLHAAGPQPRVGAPG